MAIAPSSTWPKRAGAWLRSDSIIVEEPVQIEELATRPPLLAAILEHSALRKYDIANIKVDSAGVNMMENYMLHVLDIRANYWGLESANLRQYDEKYPRGFNRLRFPRISLATCVGVATQAQRHFRIDRRHREPRRGRSAWNSVGPNSK